MACRPTGIKGGLQITTSNGPAVNAWGNAQANVHVHRD
jgi:hypothetical protein